VIDREEIRELAREFQLEPNVVEKDYALGWLLAGLSAHPSLAESWIFKGGTCLKKCFFETYRFSEDLGPLQQLLERLLERLVTLWPVAIPG